MAEVKWIKLTTDIFDDEKILLIESLPDSYAIITVWFKLLCLAGKQNNSGVFMMSNKIAYTDKMLATIFRMKESTVSMALQTFEQFGMIEIVDGVITIPNWDKHQSLDAYAKKKERDRLYQQERRNRQKLLVSKKSSDKSSDVAVSEEDKEEEKEKDIDKDIKERKKKKESSYDEILSKVTDDELRETYLEYIKMRKLIKAPMTDRALTTLINKVENLEPLSIARQKKLLEVAIMNNWKSVYPLKEDDAPKTKGAYNADLFKKMMFEDMDND